MEEAIGMVEAARLQRGVVRCERLDAYLVRGGVRAGAGVRVGIRVRVRVRVRVRRPWSPPSCTA